MTDTTRPAFACRCNGCRRRPVEWFQGMTDWHIFDKTARGGGHYFAADTRRFFSSRVLGHRVISAAGGADGVIITESKAAGWNGGRVYCATVWCRFGDLVTIGGEDYAPNAARAGCDVVASSSASLRRFLLSDAAADWARVSIATCLCHGCQIDRAEASAESVTVTA